MCASELFKFAEFTAAKFTVVSCDPSEIVDALKSSHLVSSFYGILTLVTSRISIIAFHWSNCLTIYEYYNHVMYENH